ncbi:hypothetical protein Tco_0905350 [Tanacetum coccineum]
MRSYQRLCPWTKGALSYPTPLDEESGLRYEYSLLRCGQPRTYQSHILVSLDLSRLPTTLNRLERSIYWDQQVVSELGEDEFHDDNTPPPPPPVTPTQQAPHTLSTIKLPILKKEGLHKGYDRFQSLLSQLEIHGAGVSTEDANQKYFRSLPASWSQALSTSSSSTQNVAFVSSESTNSTNDVSTTYGVSTSSGHNSQKEGSSSYTDELKIAEVADGVRGKRKHRQAKTSRSVSWQDLEKMSKRTFFDGSQQLRLDTGGNTYSKEYEESYAKLKKLYDEQREQLGVASIEIQAYTQALKKGRSSIGLQMSTRDKSGLGYGNQIHEGVLSYEKEVLESVFDSRSSDVEDSHVNDRFAKVEGMHVVPPPMTGIYMPFKSDFGIDESKFTYGPKQSKTQFYESDSDDEYVIEPSKEQEKPSFAFVNIVKHVKSPRETVKEQNM